MYTRQVAAFQIVHLTLQVRPFQVSRQKYVFMMYVLCIQISQTE